MNPPTAAPLTDKKEITDGEKAIKLHGAVVNLSVEEFEKAFSSPKGSSKKLYFLHAEVFFLLTRPLMGDPLLPVNLER